MNFFGVQVQDAMESVWGATVFGSVDVDACFGWMDGCMEGPMDGWLDGYCSNAW